MRWRLARHAALFALLVGGTSLDARGQSSCFAAVTTAYTATGSRTATGIWPYEGVVAVDPRVIPLGSTVYIDGLGHYLAADTGGGVRGAWVDVYMDSHAAAVQYGRQIRTVCA